METDTPIRAHCSPSVTLTASLSRHLEADSHAGDRVLFAVTQVAVAVSCAEATVN